MVQALATTALVLIAAAAALQIVFLIRRGEARDPASHWMLLAASVLLFAVTVARSITISFPAVTKTCADILLRLDLDAVGCRLERRRSQVSDQQRIVRQSDRRPTRLPRIKRLTK